MFDEIGLLRQARLETVRRAFRCTLSETGDAPSCGAKKAYRSPRNLSQLVPNTGESVRYMPRECERRGEVAAPPRGEGDFGDRSAFEGVDHGGGRGHAVAPCGKGVEWFTPWPRLGDRRGQRMRRC